MWAGQWSALDPDGVQVVVVWSDREYTKKWQVTTGPGKREIRTQRRFYKDVLVGKNHYWYDSVTGKFGTANRVEDIPAYVDAKNGGAVDDDVWHEIYNKAYKDWAPEWLLAPINTPAMV